MHLVFWNMFRRRMKEVPGVVVVLQENLVHPLFIISFSDHWNQFRTSLTVVSNNVLLSSDWKLCLAVPGDKDVCLAKQVRLISRWQMKFDAAFLLDTVFCDRFPALSRWMMWLCWQMLICSWWVHFDWLFHMKILVNDIDNIFYYSCYESFL